MSRAFTGKVAALVAAGALCGLALGYIPLRHQSTGKALYWSNGSNISVVLSRTGSDDLAPGEHEPALRLALEAWNQVPGSFARMVENDDALQQARSDWAADDLHLVLFDESNSSGYFPSGSATVAITPVWFQGNGRIVDADILFNGSNFQFTTSGVPGRFDVQDVAVHEFGHLLGFDHSPVVGSSLFPYVTPGLVLHRSVASDDWMATRARYPDSTLARVKGRVVRADSSPVVRAHVVLRDLSGRTIGAALADGSGNFVMEGVLPGDFELYATPLDGPVTAANLTGAPPVDIDFQPTQLATLTVVGSDDVQLGDRAVLPDAAIVLGRSFDPLPLRATIGGVRSHVLRGNGLVAGASLSAADPDIAVTVLGWFGTSVSFSVWVPSGEAPGLVDLEVTNAFGERSLLPGALELTPSDPVVNSVHPPVANANGGTSVTVGGAGFRPGASVVVGGSILRDGAPGGATVVDENTIQFVLGACPAGTYDVVVIDPTGVEGRLVDGLEAGGVPTIESVFPSAGSALGGTRVVITGAGFDSGLALTVGGVSQSVVDVSPSEIEFITTAAPPGGPYTLTLTNPSGRSDTGAFTFTALADPQVGALDPVSGPATGGEWVTLTGSDLRSDLEVRFGADPMTGQGGTSAPSTYLIDSSTLMALTPAGGGLVGLVVEDPNTGQAAALPSAYTFESSGSSGGGCGSLAPSSGPGAPFMRDMWWVALLFVICGLRVVLVRRQFEVAGQRRAVASAS
jgi:hypothetical protein